MRRRIRVASALGVVTLAALFVYVEGVVLRDLLAGLPGIRRELTLARVVLAAGAGMAAGLLAARARDWVVAHKDLAAGIGGGIVLVAFFGHQAWIGAARYWLAVEVPPVDLLGATLLRFAQVGAVAGFSAPMWLGAYALARGGVARVRAIGYGFLGLIVWSRIADRFFDLTPGFDMVALVLVSLAVLALIELAEAVADGRAVVRFHEHDATTPDAAAARAFGSLIIRRITMLPGLLAFLGAASFGFLAVARGDVGGSVATLVQLETTERALAMLVAVVAPVVGLWWLAGGRLTGSPRERREADMR